MAHKISAGRDLAVLLKSLAPILDGGGDYTFATVSEDEVSKITQPIGVFREAEGVSIVCGCEEAEKLGLKHTGRFRRITLTVHSSLDAVGLTARVATVLAHEGISCNVIAAFHHDHLFVPADRAIDAMNALRKLEGTANA